MTTAPMPASGASHPPCTYQELYGLSQSPFTASGASGDYIMFGTHRRCFDAVLNHLLNGTGILLLTGDAGIGKTAMLQTVAAMANESPRQAHLITRPEGGRIIRAQLETAAALWLAPEIPPPRRPRGLLIDDIDLLPTDTAHALAHLLRDPARPTAIVLTSSTTHLAETARADLAALLKSPNSVQHLPHLIPAETRQYIERALWRAGGTTRRLISPDALRAIAARANGIPAAANRLMEAALLAGFARQDRIITTRTIAALLAPPTRPTPPRTRRLGDTAERMLQIGAVTLLACGITVFAYKAMQAPQRPTPGQTALAKTR